MKLVDSVRLAAFVGGLLVTHADAVLAQGVCGQGRPNVVLIVVDDVGWTGFPFLNPPLNWTPVQNPPGSRQLQSPTHNRLDARLHAVPDFQAGAGSLGTYTPSHDFTPLDEGFSASSPWSPYLVRPIEGTTQYVAAETCAGCTGRRTSCRDTEACGASRTKAWSSRTSTPRRGSAFRPARAS